MSSIIQIDLPRNIKDHDLSFFKPLSYELNKTKILNLNNVFLTHGGIAWKGINIIKETTYGHPEVRAKQYRETFKAFISAKIFKTWPYEKLSGEQFLTIFHPWCNYYHFLMDMYERALRARDKFNSTTLILPSYFKQYTYVEELLQTLNLKKIYELEDNKHAEVKDLIIPELRANSKKYDPEMLSAIRKHLFDFYQVKLSSNPKRRIFLSRQSAQHRRILNWSEVSEVLKANNIEIISIENKTVKEQIELINDCRLVISVHGADLTNILFLSENSKILELMPKPPKGYFVNPLYWYLASVRNLDYYYFFYEISNFDVLLKEDMQVDCDGLAKLLKKL